MQQISDRDLNSLSLESSEHLERSIMQWWRVWALESGRVSLNTMFSTFNSMAFGVLINFNFNYFYVSVSSSIEWEIYNSFTSQSNLKIKWDNMQCAWCILFHLTLTATLRCTCYCFSIFRQENWHLEKINSSQRSCYYKWQSQESLLIITL